MNMTPWLKRVSGGASVLAAATRIKADQSTLNRQLKAGPPADVIVAIARAYDADPVAALVEAGFITAREADAGHDLSEAEHLAWLSDAADDVLLAEIGRRLKDRSDLGEPGSR